MNLPAALRAFQHPNFRLFFIGQSGSMIGTWMQQIAAIFPLKWLTQGMRSVFLPDSFASQEVAKSWELQTTFLVLVLWLIIGIFFSVRKFKWERD